MDKQIALAAELALKLSGGDHIAAQKLMLAAMEVAGLIEKESIPRINAKPISDEPCTPKGPGRFKKGEEQPFRCCPDCRRNFVREAFVTKAGARRAHCPDCRRRRNRASELRRQERIEVNKIAVLKTFEDYQKEAAYQRLQYGRSKIAALLQEAASE